MPRRLNVTDGYAIINTMAAEMFGQNATITAIDESSFVSVGESILQSGIENVINTLSLVCSRDLVAIRPYAAKFRLINALDSGMFANRIRKISYYAKNAVPTGASNTDLYPENLGMGWDNGVHQGGTPLVDKSVESMWLQSTPVVYQAWFGGAIEWQYPYTLYENALKGAFRSGQEWADFLNGFLVSCANDIETEKEAFSRLVVLNHIAGVADLTSDMPQSFRNLTTEFNTKFNITPAYTTQQLLTTYLSEFLAFFVATVKTDSDMLENRSTLYHWSPTKTVNGVSYVLPRQTKKADQRMMMISRFWNDAEAMVLPAIFNDQYLKIDNFEKIDYWQNINDPMAISVTPAIPDTSDPSAQTTGAAVSLSTVLGVLYDRDAMMVDFHLEDVASSPLEARKHYRTIWHTINKNPINDFTENCIVYYMAD